MQTFEVAKEKRGEAFNIPGGIFFNPELSIKDGVPFVNDIPVKSDGLHSIIQFRKSEPLLGYFKAQIGECTVVLFFAGAHLYRAYKIFFNQDLFERENKWFESKQPENPGIGSTIKNFTVCSEQVYYLSRILESWCYDPQSDCLHIVYGREGFEEALQKVFHEYSKLMEPKNLLGS